MANTNTITYTLANPKEVQVYYTMESDGTNETKLVIYDSSVVAASTISPAIADPLHCRLMEIHAIANTASTARLKLEFDATTSVLMHSLALSGQNMFQDYRHIGGLPNYAGAGRTGDITLTTAGLASGDTITIVMSVIPA